MYIFHCEQICIALRMNASTDCIPLESDMLVFHDVDMERCETDMNDGEWESGFNQRGGGSKQSKPQEKTSDVPVTNIAVNTTVNTSPRADASPVNHSQTEKSEKPSLKRSFSSDRYPLHPGPYEDTPDTHPSEQKKMKSSSFCINIGDRINPVQVKHCHDDDFIIFSTRRLVDGQLMDEIFTLEIFRYKVLVQKMQAVNDALGTLDWGRSVHYSAHLGSHYYVSVKSPYIRVSIRKWYRDRLNKLAPTREGISLKPSHWQKLCKLSNYINSMVKLEDVQTCVESHGDGNQESVLGCLECTPDGTGLVQGGEEEEEYYP